MDARTSKEVDDDGGIAHHSFHMCRVRGKSTIAKSVKRTSLVPRGPRTDARPARQMVKSGFADLGYHL
ncbi:hypothetical protein Tco_1113595 [Tanacetum coccineum]|uniref:Uncharacterized protein n=1 Tax=Tanacetum coccineum TaxID=301880 RepID=A0ABQ5IUY6_9ASTR